MAAKGGGVGLRCTVLWWSKGKKRKKRVGVGEYDGEGGYLFKRHPFFLSCTTLGVGGFDKRFGGGSIVVLVSWL